MKVGKKPLECKGSRFVSISRCQNVIQQQETRSWFRQQKAIRSLNHNFQSLPVCFVVAPQTSRWHRQRKFHKNQNQTNFDLFTALCDFINRVQRETTNKLINFPLVMNDNNRVVLLVEFKWLSSRLSHRKTQFVSTPIRSTSKSLS